MDWGALAGPLRSQVVRSSHARLTIHQTNAAGTVAGGVLTIRRI